jgi:hypothetical protein
VPSDDRDSFSNFACVCEDGFSGKICEKYDTKLIFHFPMCQFLNLFWSISSKWTNII